MRVTIHPIKLGVGRCYVSHETEEVGFFPEGRLPDLSISRVTPGQIARLFEHHRHPDLQTDFDYRPRTRSSTKSFPAALASVI